MMIRFLFLLLLALTSLVRAEEPLRPEAAFRFSARVVDAKTIEARWQITDKYYMYRDKFKFELDGGTVGTPTFPSGKMKMDENFGNVEVYRKEVKILIPVTATGAVTLKAVSQGCWDGGICYPPLKQDAKLDLAAAPAAMGAGAVSPAPTSDAVSPGNETSRIAGLFKGGSLAVVLVSFFGFGLLLSLTPCVFPMIPILSGIIVNHGHAVTQLRAFVLSLAYVLGMAITYSAVGIAAGLSGTLLSAALQNPWMLGGFALIFVVLSFSMFGFYELQMPVALQSRVSTTANRQGGSLPAIAVMGALSALMVGPCVAAPMAGALLYIAKTGDAALGGMALFTMAMGMGTPLLLVGTFSRSLLPKSGPWMGNIKKFFGVMMLATALWMITPIIPLWLQMLGWALLMVVPAIHLHALDPLPPHAGGWYRLGKGLGVALLIGGAAMLLGVLGGAKDPLQPLGFMRGGGTGAAAEAPATAFEYVKTPQALDARLAEAKAAGKPVMLYFYADWCVTCKELERFTFTEAQVAFRLKDLVLLKADVTADTDVNMGLLLRYDLYGPPGIIFYDAKGQEQVDLRTVGYLPADKFLPILERALRKS